MKVIADLHIHSRFSRATSPSINFQNLEKYARMKGIGLLGTGDFTHPEWIKEIKENLTDDGSGILKTKTEFPFVLQSEISLMYTANNRGRRVHVVLLAPSLDVVGQITDYLKTSGRVDYDGRPIFRIPCPEFVESLKKISDNIEIIPAHVWTPWFSVFGSKSGFDSVEECFGDQAKHIFGLETGLSSNPAMNWRLSQLDKYSLVSFSDMHSHWPWRMGREASVFDIDLTYRNLIKAVRTKQGLIETIEVDPSYGKYHIDGHRNCDVSMNPEETKKHNGICPKCERKLTIGVLSRVEELADRPEGFRPEGAIPFKSLIPLSEIISIRLGYPLASKKTWDVFNRLIKEVGSELNVLTGVSLDRLKSVVNEKLAKAIVDVRMGKVRIKAGFDGEYGQPIFDGGPEELKEKDFVKRQKDLGDFVKKQ